MKELTQEVFKGQPKEVDWCGVDYDGTLNFGVMTENPRYTWGSERWRGFKQIGESRLNTKYKPLTSLRRKTNKMDKVEELIIDNNDDKEYQLYKCKEHGVQAHRKDFRHAGLCSYCGKHMDVYIKTYADRLRIAINDGTINKNTLIDTLKITPKEFKKLLKNDSFDSAKQLVISVYFDLKPQ